MQFLCENHYLLSEIVVNERAFYGISSVEVPHFLHTESENTAHVNELSP